MDEASAVTFVEAAGADAEADLRGTGDRLARRGVASELLRSTERDDLWLLVVRGNAAETALPAGARTWRFVVAPGARSR